MEIPKRGEVWLVDLGLAAKVRPVLVVSIPYADGDYALTQVVPHTTHARGSQFEVQLPVHFLEVGVFNVQGMLAVPTVKFLKRLGVLSPAHMSQVEDKMKQWLNIKIE